MPTPHPGSETKKEWLDRCIPYLIKIENKTQSQAVGQCNGMWESAKKKQKKK